MRASRRNLGISVVFAAAACSSEAPPSQVAPITASAPAPETGGAPALYYFEGTVDTARGEMKVTTRSRAGGLTEQATIPYGTGAGQVYFHTCPTPTFSANTLTGQVQAVNNTGKTITNLTSVIDSVSPVGVTPSSGTIASYGTVAAGTVANCGTSSTWSFTTPSAGNFTFLGHATGYVDGLVALYTLDEGSGTVIGDTSGNAQGITASSGTWQGGHLGNGHVGPAASNAALPLTTTATISLWIKRLGSASAYPRIVSFTGDTLEIADYSNSGILGVYNGAWNNTGVTIATATFMHVAVTMDASAMKVYVNGSLSNTYPGNRNLSGNLMYLGRRHTDAGSENFNGVIDQVRVYNRVLSASEVTSLAAE